MIMMTTLTATIIIASLALQVGSNATLVNIRKKREISKKDRKDMVGMVITFVVASPALPVA